jgi:hypothetical protein
MLKITNTSSCQLSRLAWTPKIRHNFNRSSSALAVKMAPIANSFSAMSLNDSDKSL